MKSKPRLSVEGILLRTIKQIRRDRFSGFDAVILDTALPQAVKNRLSKTELISSQGTGVVEWNFDSFTPAELSRLHGNLATARSLS